MMEVQSELLLCRFLSCWGTSSKRVLLLMLMTCVARDRVQKRTRRGGACAADSRPGEVWQVFQRVVSEARLPRIVYSYPLYETRLACVAFDQASFCGQAAHRDERDHQVEACSSSAFQRSLKSCF